MNKNIQIRELRKNDLPQVKHIIDENQMFPSEYLDEMVTEYFDDSSQELWFVAEHNDGQALSIAYCAPEQMTQGTWNLLLIAVAKSEQGQGIGAQLISAIENKLKQLAARILLVETSGLPDFQLTRQFYPKTGFKQVASIPEFYDQGDDKIVFWKSLVG
ncbi:MAG: GNAT family N-acetyltransferase [Alteromonadaceae bacterium]|nr:GNAT family N-acetyltransferase [Alteromonadaceae bacterium]